MTQLHKTLLDFADETAPVWTQTLGVEFDKLYTLALKMARILELNAAWEHAGEVLNEWEEFNK